MNIRQFVEQLVIRQKSFAYDPQRFTSYEKYSTTEQVVGEWIDGKTLYSRTFQGVMPSYTGSGIAVNSIDISVLNCDTVFVSEAFQTGALPIYSGPYMGNPNTSAVQGNSVVRISQDKKALQLLNGNSAYNSAPVTAVLKYTKTTD